MYTPEIELLVSSIYHYFSFVVAEISPGMKAMRLKFVGSKSHRNIVFVILVLNWGLQRATKVSNSRGWKALDETDARKKLADVLLQLDRVCKFVRLVNKLAFISNGRYPSVLHRVSNYELEDLGDGNSSNVVKQAQVFVKDRQLIADVFTGFMQNVVVAVSCIEMIYREVFRFNRV